MRRIALLASLSVLLAPAVAAAVEPAPRPVPGLTATPQAPGVAVTTQRAELETATPAGLCVTAVAPVAPGEADPPVSDGSTCGDPTLADDDALLLDEATHGDGAAFLAGAVPAGAARVVLTTGSGHREAFPVAATPAYAGPLAGRIAFFVARTSLDRTDVVEARIERPDGTALGVSDLGAAFGGSVTPGLRAGPTQRTRVRTRAGTLEVVTTARSVLSPSAAALERRDPTSCTAVLLAGRPLRGDEDAACATAAGGSSPPRVTPVCAAGRIVVTGLAPTGTRVTVVLGSGRRVPVPLGPGDVLPGRRALTYVAPASEGVRRIDGVPDAAGMQVGLPPARLACALAGDADQPVLDRASIARFTAQAKLLAPGSVAALATPSGVALQAVDGPDGTLCVALAVRPPAASCAALRRGRVRVATRAPDGPYAGAYAGAVRTFATVLPPRDFVASVEALDANGASQILGVLSVGRIASAPARIGSVARLGAGVRAWASVGGRGRDAYACAGAATSRPLLVALDCLSTVSASTSVVVQAPCVARRIVVSAVLREARARLTVRLTDGSRLVGRRIALGGRLPGKPALHVLLLPPAARPASVAVTGAAGPDLRRRLPAPSPRRQCGYLRSAERDG